MVEVAKGSPADKAGLRVGDVIVAANGRGVREWLPICATRSTYNLPVGEEGGVQGAAGGREQALRARVEPVRSAEASGSESIPGLASALLVGTAERDGRPEAVAVVEVTRGSPAWSHGGCGPSALI